MTFFGKIIRPKGFQEKPLQSSNPYDYEAILTRHPVIKVSTLAFTSIKWPAPGLNPFSRGWPYNRG